MDAVGPDESRSDHDAATSSVVELSDDAPIVTDSLPSSAAVGALVELLLDPESTAPAVYGVAGRFGTGKTTFLRTLARRLQGAPSSPEGTAWCPVFVSLQDTQINRREQLWAVLTTAVHTQVERALPSGLDRLRFRMRLVAARMGRRAFLFRVVVPTIFGLLLAVAGVVSVIAGAVGWLAPVAALAGVVVAAGTTLRQHLAALQSPVAWLRDSSVVSGVSAELPIFDTVRTELTNLLAAAGPTMRILVLLDGLDQPQPQQLTEVLEGVSAVRRLHELAIVIVLAMDADLVAASIEASFSPTWAEALRSRSHPLADIDPEAQIAEVVDLSIVLPSVDSPVPARWLESFLSPNSRPDATPEQPKPRITSQMAESAMALIGYLPQPVNPRGAKQYLRALRLQMHLVAATVDLGTVDADALARYVLLRRRWPALAAASDRKPELLGALDEAVRTGEGSDEVRAWLAQADLGGILRDAATPVSSLPLGDFVHVT